MQIDPITDEQCREVVDAYERNGFNKQHAADDLGMQRGKYRHRFDAARKRGFVPEEMLLRATTLAREGHAPGHFDSGTAPGFLMGKVTVQRNNQGDVERTWERQSPDQAQSEEAFRQSLADLVSTVRGLAPAVTPPAVCDDDLLAVIPMGDPHFGMLSWARETGEDFDLAIAEQVTVDAVDRLTSLVPPAGTAMLLNLGDFFHADNASNRTPRSGAPLDVDGRFPKIASVGFRAMVRCINRMREKHRRVIVRCNRGNHDPHQAFMLAMALDAYFHEAEGVEVDLSPSSFYYFRFGKVLIGSTHGDGAKLADLPLIMATDTPQDWAAAEYRHWHCGHFHHDQKLVAKESPGCTVETHRTLAARDSWHTHEGYRTGRDMKAIIYHKEHGEITRLRCGIQTLGVAA